MPSRLMDIPFKSRSIAGWGTRHEPSLQWPRHRAHRSPGFDIRNAQPPASPPAATKACATALGFFAPHATLCAFQSAFWHVGEQYRTRMWYLAHDEQLSLALALHFAHDPPAALVRGGDMGLFERVREWASFVRVVAF